MSSWRPGTCLVPAQCRWCSVTWPSSGVALRAVPQWPVAAWKRPFTPYGYRTGKVWVHRRRRHSWTLSSLARRLTTWLSRISILGLLAYAPPTKGASSFFALGTGSEIHYVTGTPGQLEQISAVRRFATQSSDMVPGPDWRPTGLYRETIRKFTSGTREIDQSRDVRIPRESASSDQAD